MADRRTKAELLLDLDVKENLLSQTRSEVRSARDLSDALSKRVREVQKAGVERRKAEYEKRRELQKELRLLKEQVNRPEPGPFEKMINTTIEAIPASLQVAVKEIAFDPSMSDIVKRVMEREREFPTPQRALIAACAMDPTARAYLDDTFVFCPGLRAEEYRGREVVIGSGVHAAIYCAVRVARGYPPPIVIESKDRIGGAFSSSFGPSFFLNSRNRPGELAIPGVGALNFLPGAMAQPSDLSGEEYQANDVLGFLARMTVASNSILIHGKVASVVPQNSRLASMDLEGGATIRNIDRIVIATGLGEPTKYVLKNGGRVLSFDQFMARMDGPFPLAGMKRVAVIGAGDSGKTAIESLCGQGPPTRSMASLDWPEAIDWYGVPPDRQTREGWEQCVRRRYRGIARLLPSPGVPARVTPKGNGGLVTVASGYECVYADGVPYDYVIACIGFRPADSLADLAPGYSFSNYSRDGMVLGLQINGYPIYVVGPAASLPVTRQEEPILRQIDENKTALFRYAPRTAAFAAM